MWLGLLENPGTPCDRVIPCAVFPHWGMERLGLRFSLLDCRLLTLSAAAQSQRMVTQPELWVPTTQQLTGRKLVLMAQPARA